MRGKGEGGLYRVPSDKSQPLKYWEAAVELPSIDGKRRRKRLHSKNKKVLLDKLAALQSDLRKRGDIPTADQTVEQWFTYWLSEYVVKGTRPKNAAGNRSVIKNHIIPVIGKQKLEKVNAASVRRVTNRMTDDLGLSSTYALNAHNIMSSAFEAAIKEGRIGRNPTKLVNAPKKAVAAQEAFTLDEALAVLDHVADDAVWGARWATAMLTAARRGEVLGLERDRVGDVLDLSWQLQRLKVTGVEGKPDVPADFEYRHLKGGLYLTRPKSRAGWRIVPLVEPLKSILARHMGNNPPNNYGLVFATSDGEPRDPDQDTAAWNEVLAETGIQRKVVLHGLRHTAVDLLYMAGVPEDLIMEIVGHSARSTTRGYKSRGNDARLRSSMDKLTALLTRPDGAHSETPAISE